jgi:TRAP-type C4-dicarboxylate transport system permease small subunit
MHLRLGAHSWLDRLAALTDGVVRLMRVAATATLLMAVALNFANVIGRYFFNAPIAWAEEVMLFMQVGVVFLAAVAVSREGRHIRMDVAVNLLPAVPRRILEALAGLVEIAVAVAVAWLAIPLVKQLAEFDQRSQAAQLPLAIPQALVPLGFVLIAVVVAVRLARK